MSATTTASTAGQGPAESWRARWVPAPGRVAWADFTTHDQAELFALRRPGTIVEVVRVAAPVGPPALRVVPGAVDGQDADRFASLVAGEPARTADERSLLDVVAGLRRTSLPPVPARVSREMRDRLLSPAS